MISSVKPALIRESTSHLVDGLLAPFLFLAFALVNLLVVVAVRAQTIFLLLLDSQIVPPWLLKRIPLAESVAEHLWLVSLEN